MKDGSAVPPVLAVSASPVTKSIARADEPRVRAFIAVMKSESTDEQRAEVNRVLDVVYQVEPETVPR